MSTGPAIHIPRREREVLALGAAGRSVRQIAAALGVHRRVVSACRKALTAQHGAEAMADLPALAARLGVKVAA